MKTWTAFLLLTVSSLVSAVPPADVTNLKDQYQKALKKATDPITEVYKKELLQLLDQYKKSKDIEGIAAVTEELTHLGTIMAVRASDIPTAKEQNNLRFFVNKSWFSAANTEYHFEKDTTGYRIYLTTKTPFTWRRLDNGLVEAIGRMKEGGPAVTWFFKFDNGDTAVFGNTPDVLQDRLRSEK
jgi:hypothetical protein